MSVRGERAWTNQGERTFALAAVPDPSPTASLGRDMILQAVAQLSAERRAVLLRSYYQARTIAQIADDLDIDEETVTSRLHHGLRALLLSLQKPGIRKPGNRHV